MTRDTVRSNISNNLYDLGISFFTETDINNAIQDAYNEIAFYTQCITKVNPNMSFVSGLTYYDFISLGVTDYLGTWAIFNQSTNLWLQDNLTVRDLDRIRRDWENWTGNPIFWTTHSLRYTVIAPKPFMGAQYSGLFNLYYWAAAPVVADDVTPYLIATDMTILLEWHATGNLVESQDEPTKAQDYLVRYEEKAMDYKQRVKNQAKADVLYRL